MSEIIFIDPGSIVLSEGNLYLASRTLLGYRNYKQYLEENYPDISFKVTFLNGAINETTDNLARVDEELRSHIILEKFSEYRHKIFWDDKIALSLLNPHTLWLHEEKIPLVYLVEFSRQVRLDALLANGKPKLLDYTRIKLGQIKLEREYRKALKNVMGVAINGDGAYASYGSLNPNTIKFYDHRITAVPEKLNQRQNNRLNIAYSGRLTPVKGSNYLPAISHRLKEKLPDSHFYLLGQGEQKENIISNSANNLIDKGFMDYKTEWEPFIKEEVDVMIFPHPQGDPSMTYFEALGQGVPLLGFENETLTPLAQKGLGWAVPRGDTDALVQKLVELQQNPQLLEDARQNAVDFMKENLYSKILERRMEHLVTTILSKKP